MTSTRNELLLLISLGFITLFLIGCVCNFLVITHNGGNMPAKDVDVFGHEDYIAYNDTTINQIEYEELADRYGFDYNNYAYRFSIGDVIIIFGFIGLAIHLIWYSIRNFRGIE